MKVAIVGSSGYIARYIINCLKEKSKIDSIIRIDKTGEIDAVFDLVNPLVFDYGILNDVDYVIFTAAVSSPDQCANNFDSCWAINVIGTSYFIKEALNRKCKVLFFSSDAVFGEDLGIAFDENSKTMANTAYGRMKKAIEDEFRGNTGFKAIRLSYVASARDRFISYCLDCIRKDETADVFHPFYRNVTVVSDVINVVVYLIFHWDEYTPTFLNVAGRELVSRVRMADEINRVYSGRLKYTISFPSEEFFSNRHQITQMRSLYMASYRIVDDNTFTEKIVKELEGTVL